MSESLVSVTDLTLAFGESENPVLRGVSFDIPKGQTLALVGESGSGKSVSALSILRLLPEQSTRYLSGNIRYDNQDLLSLKEPQLRAIRGDRISMIFQEPMTSLNPLHTVGKQIAENLYLHGNYNRSNAKKRVIELLELVGIRDPEQRLRSYPHELSGGQRQRVMIAMALANEPDLLIADEPTTALDVTIQKQILDLLRSLQEQLGMSILLITHDLNIVRRYAQQVCVMYQGQIVESAETQKLFATPEHPYTCKLLNSEPEGSATPIPADAEQILCVKELGVSFARRSGLFARNKNPFVALQQANFSLQRGETLGIVGESGSGKSTLAMAVMRLTRSQGEILFANQDINRLNQKALRPLRAKIQIVFQDPFGSLSPRMSIEEIIAEGLRVQGEKSETVITEKVSKVLKEVGLDESFRHRYPHEFSGGQRQRISIARALVLKPDLIILDEPTSALDRSVQKQIIELLRDLQSRYQISYIFISHDLAVVKALSHRVMVLKEGQVVEEGSAEQIFNAPTQTYTQQLINATRI